MAYPLNVQVNDDAVVIALPPDPIDGTAREAEIMEVAWIKHRKEIVTVLAVFFLDQQGERITNSERKPVYSVPLIANATNMVNQYGQVIPAKIDDPENEGQQIDNPEVVADEYSFYIAAFKTPQILFEVLALAYNDAIASDRYDI